MSVNKVFYYLIGPDYKLYYRNPTSKSIRSINANTISSTNLYRKHYKNLQNRYNTYNPLNARRHGFSRNQNKMALSVLKRILNNKNVFLANKNRITENNIKKVYNYASHLNNFNYPLPNNPLTSRYWLRSTNTKRKLRNNLNRSQLHAYKKAPRLDMNPLNLLARNYKNRRYAKTARKSLAFYKTRNRRNKETYYNIHGRPISSDKDINNRIKYLNKYQR